MYEEVGLSTVDGANALYGRERGLLLPGEFLLKKKCGCIRKTKITNLRECIKAEAYRDNSHLRILNLFQNMLVSRLSLLQKEWISCTY